MSSHKGTTGIKKQKPRRFITPKLMFILLDIKHFMLKLRALATACQLPAKKQQQTQKNRKKLTWSLQYNARWKRNSINCLTNISFEIIQYLLKSMYLHWGRCIKEISFDVFLTYLKSLVNEWGSSTLNGTPIYFSDLAQISHRGIIWCSYTNVIITFINARLKSMATVSFANSLVITGITYNLSP